jgi:hypothetical protein
VSYLQRTGILWLDVPRIARYDMLVPVFALGALHAYLTARKSSAAGWYFLAGALAGMAGLAHVYGLFWLPALSLVAILDGRKPAEHAGETRSGLGYLVLGAAAAWLPYGLYVLSGWTDWRGQTLNYAGRFNLLDPQFYVGNLWAEWERYDPGIESPRAALLRFGFWTTLIGLPASLAALLWRGLVRNDPRARLIAVPLIVLPLLFALLIALKLVNYTATIAPLAAVAMAWGIVSAWDRAGRARGGALMRAGLALAAILVSAEVGRRVYGLETAARELTPYPAFVEVVKRQLPANGRVLGLPNYWFGLEEFDYRSFHLPLWWSDPVYEERPVSFLSALDRVSPDIVLVDERMRNYFQNTGTDDPRPAEFRAWLAARGARLTGLVDDKTYGRMEIYAVERAR